MILTAEPKVTQLSAEEKEEIQSFRPPIVEVGQPVLYFLRSSTRPQDRSLGWVWDNSNPRCIKVYVPHESGGSGGAVRDGVFHCTDPNLKRSQDIRDAGSWDFTDAEKERRRVEQELNDRMTALEMYRVFTGRNDRHFMLKLAKRMGLNPNQKDTNDDLRRRLAEGFTQIVEAFNSAADEIEQGTFSIEEEPVQEEEEVVAEV